MSTLKHPVRTFEYATIVNVVDGDTCDIELDLGFTVKVRTRFRLARINAPEVGKPGAADATAFLRQFLSKPVTVVSSKTDNYGRYLADILDPSFSKEFINDLMLERGLAVPYAS